MGLPGRDNLEYHSLAQPAEAHIIIVNLSMSLEYQISIIYVVNNNVTIFSPTLYYKWCKIKYLPFENHITMSELMFSFSWS